MRMSASQSCLGMLRWGDTLRGQEFCLHRPDGPALKLNCCAKVAMGAARNEDIPACGWREPLPSAA